ncbi:hypothetical protein D3C77_552000 [compost metagenome]
MINFETAADNFPEVLFTDSSGMRHFQNMLSNVNALIINKVMIRRSLEQVLARRLVNVREAGWENFVKNNPADRRYEQCVLLFLGKSFLAEGLSRDSYAGMQRYRAPLICGHRFMSGAKNHPRSLGFLIVHRQIVGAENHIL